MRQKAGRGIIRRFQGSTENGKAPEKARGSRETEEFMRQKAAELMYNAEKPAVTECI